MLEKQNSDMSARNESVEKPLQRESELRRLNLRRWAGGEPRKGLTLQQDNLNDYLKGGDEQTEPLNAERPKLQLRFGVVLGLSGFLAIIAVLLHGR